MKTLIAIFGVVGMVLIQGATIPATIASYSGGALPPLIMVLQSAFALLLLFVHSCYHRFTLYALGNFFGLGAQCFVLYLILTRG